MILSDRRGTPLSVCRTHTAKQLIFLCICTHKKPPDKREYFPYIRWSTISDIFCFARKKDAVSFCSALLCSALLCSALLCSALLGLYLYSTYSSTPFFCAFHPFYTHCFNKNVPLKVDTWFFWNPTFQTPFLPFSNTASPLFINYLLFLINIITHPLLPQYYQKHKIFLWFIIFL